MQQLVSLGDVELSLRSSAVPDTVVIEVLSTLCLYAKPAVPLAPPLVPCEDRGKENDAVSLNLIARLTAREKVVVGYLMAGYKNRQIGDLIGVKEQVIKNTLKDIYDKVGCNDRVSLLLFVFYHPMLRDTVALDAFALAPG